MNSFRRKVFTVAPPEIQKCDLIRCINLKIRGMKNMKYEKMGGNKSGLKTKTHKN